MSEARTAARGGAANPWTRWQCFKEDAIVGYAVHSVASLLALNVTVASLRPRIIDAAEAREATTQTVARLVTLHKLEPDEQVLSKNEAFEDRENAYYRTINISTANHKHVHAAFNRRLRPLLERLPEREREWRATAREAALAAGQKSRSAARGHEPNARRGVRPWHTELRCYARNSKTSWAGAFSWVAEFCRYQPE